MLLAGRKSLKIEGRASTPSTILKRAKLHARLHLQPGVQNSGRCSWHPMHGCAQALAETSIERGFFDSIEMDSS